MVRRTVSIILLVVASLSLRAQVGFETTEELAKAVLETLKSQDFDAYKNYIGAKSDFQKIFAVKLQKRPEMREMAVRMQYENYITHMSNNYAHVMQVAEENGVDWSRVEFAGSKEKRTTERIDLDGKPLTRYRVEVYFTAGEQKLKMHLSECYQLDRGWVNWGNLSWKW